MAKRKQHSLVQEGGFEDYGTARIDAKRRLLLKGEVAEHYRVYCNDAGQILLDPQVMIPAREIWGRKGKKALHNEDELLAKIATDRIRRSSGKRVSWQDLKP